MSKFTFSIFTDVYNNREYVAVNKQKYSKEKAFEIAQRELNFFKDTSLIFDEEVKYVRYGFFTRDGEKENDYYLDNVKRKNSIECWVWRTK